MTKKIIDYLVWTAETEEELESIVREHLAVPGDWQPFGGVSVSLSESDDYRYVIFAQAMVRYEGKG